MNKLIAIVNVVAWSGFWAFGYIALTAQDLSDHQLITASFLAFAGFIMGIVAYPRLVRAAEASGYAKKTNQLDTAARNRAQSEGGM
ncbi:hypothetical protein OEZ49_14020 [Ruegeria sp. WL0004]|uniref:Uncharacterized protein n=1 Tax=Ruegeria marisflavi TaxID=2984152 RepID=A0ABT2WSM1_9RHOB|nr:hypothetical protein [Ruegeria sp. WL0004]MCU9838890.1 hypothetical protein [Ruegeria sp. WL0004]